eukprot:CAMPEP_0185902600 /NCGR_PEP_ID=MMETSP0196C-20130402/1829_1 /TAXON_ID=2932 /ORGANISM="Alexandrium fundyense, Strain CCMP1719" /LENGTH=62 /DNA_ID=CAMNT_0028621485 /DNA_START=82 /DNA_END=266 /DNA_ORIENTATION=-
MAGGGRSQRDSSFGATSFLSTLNRLASSASSSSNVPKRLALAKLETILAASPCVSSLPFRMA